MIKIAHTDIESTGTKHWRHGIHQIGIIFEIDGVIKERLKIDMKPFFLTETDPKALEVCGITAEQLNAKPAFHHAMPELMEALARYVDITDPLDKYFISGYNTNLFDVPFIQAFFEHNRVTTYNSWFWRGSLDTMVLALEVLKEEIHLIPSFSLTNVAKHLKINHDTDGLHDALYDAELSRKVRKKLLEYGSITS